MNDEETMRKLAEECDTSVHLFVKDNQLFLVHSPFDSEDEVLNILNNAVSNLIYRGAIDKASGNLLQ
jgi:hypothetical protein